MDKWRWTWKELSPEARKLVENQFARPTFVKGAQYLADLKAGRNGLYVSFVRDVGYKAPTVLKPSVMFDV